MRDWTNDERKMADEVATAAITSVSEGLAKVLLDFELAEELRGIFFVTFLTGVTMGEELYAH